MRLHPYLHTFMVSVSTFLGCCCAAASAAASPSLPSTAFAASCLGYTGLTPLVYPTDAAVHYREIHEVLSPWAQTPMHSVTLLNYAVFFFEMTFTYPKRV